MSRSDPYGGGSGGGGSVAVDTDFTYDAAGRVTGISHTADEETLADYTFTWDAAGQLVGEISTEGTLDFTYHVTGQVTGVSGWRTESCGYALAGS